MIKEELEKEIASLDKRAYKIYKKLIKFLKKHDNLDKRCLAIMMIIETARIYKDIGYTYEDYVDRINFQIADYKDHWNEEWICG
jgi:adenylosuccinate synthase